MTAASHTLNLGSKRRKLKPVSRSSCLNRWPKRLKLLLSWSTRRLILRKRHCWQTNFSSQARFKTLWVLTLCQKLRISGRHKLSRFLWKSQRLRALLPTTPSCLSSIKYLLSRRQSYNNRRTKLHTPSVSNPHKRANCCNIASLTPNRCTKPRSKSKLHTPLSRSTLRQVRRCRICLEFPSTKWWLTRLMHSKKNLSIRSSKA